MCPERSRLDRPDREVQPPRRFASGAGAFGGGGIRARATSWGSPTSALPSADEPPPPSFRLGDDVVHAAFGEGVVTGVEPGGIVVIRFSRDRAERKLVADLAPITKR